MLFTVHMIRSVYLNPEHVLIVDVYKFCSISVPLIVCFHADGHYSFYYLQKFLE